MDSATIRENRTQRQLVSLARRHRLLWHLADYFSRRRAQTLLSLFKAWLPSAGLVLDVGTGTGHVAAAIRALGLQIVTCDIADLALVPLPRAIADGARLPFGDGRFDAVLLVTVLHHVPAPRQIAMLAEGIRVLRPRGRLLIVEDSYEGRLERLVTSALDSVLNFEFVGHPHANRTTHDWERLIAELGQSVLHCSEHRVRYGPFQIRHLVVAVERAPRLQSTEPHVSVTA